MDIDNARRGEHTAFHVACLLEQLPSDARVRVANDKDSTWTLNDTLLAGILNNLNGLMWGMGGGKDAGIPEPALIGPSFMADARKSTVPALVMTVEELNAELAKPRKNNLL